MAATENSSSEAGVRRLLYNWTSIVGIALLVVAGSLAVVMWIADLLGAEENPYLGLVYLLLGVLAAAALALVILGALMAARRRRKGTPWKPLALLTLDLNRQRDRYLALGSVFLLVMGMGAMTTASYKTVVYAESDAFCGGACHSVMRPEATTHALSPHAKVGCAECHVGTGAGSFAQSKLRGARQLLHVITGAFPKPIGVPIHSMRPAREICESCHWRDRWVGYKEVVNTYFSSEPDNKESGLRLLVKVGGTHAGLISGEGIHYHMMLGRTVEFAAADAAKQHINWVRVTEPDGAKRVFRRVRAGSYTAPPEGATLYRMDCLDCHNRPAHRFVAPMNTMNAYLAGGRIDRSLPSIKKKGVEVLSADYPDTATAKTEIAKTLNDYYAKEFPTLGKPDSVAAAVAAVQEIYERSMFPEMKVRWSSYPDNLGHRDSVGCFRCHNETLKDASGKTVFTTCTGCHVVLSQGDGDGSGVVDFAKGQVFYHAAGKEHLDKYTNCVECHTGGADTY
jgi:NapC/NirT cytochrome c family protein